MGLRPKVAPRVLGRARDSAIRLSRSSRCSASHIWNVFHSLRSKSDGKACGGGGAGCGLGAAEGTGFVAGIDGAAGGLGGGAVGLLTAVGLREACAPPFALLRLFMVSTIKVGRKVAPTSSLFQRIQITAASRTTRGGSSLQCTSA